MKMDFQVLTVVRLVTPDPRPPDGPDDDRIQAEHLAYLRGLGDEGKIAVNGPKCTHSEHAQSSWTPDSGH